MTLRSANVFSSVACTGRIEKMAVKLEMPLGVDLRTAAAPQNDSLVGVTRFSNEILRSEKRNG